MGIFSFIKEAGEKFIERGRVQGGQQAAPAAQPTAQPAAPAQPVDPAAANATAAKAIRDYVVAMQLDASQLDFEFDGASATVRVRGQVPDQVTKEKVVLCCGNVSGVERVDDQITVAQQAQSAQEAQFHTVQAGDTLSKIAQKVYGNASAYQKIFEANRPMLSHPDRIYPGQVLRIPPQDGA